MPSYNPGAGFRRGNRRFGRQVHPITGKVTGHNGDDWPAPEGTSIPAAVRNRYWPCGFCRCREGHNDLVRHGVNRKFVELPLPTLQALQQLHRG